ncbi:hypothetical protein [Magnetospirillum sulfuroxidans]|uniref:Uncharacterized protein n=1 Tax=Magnetospirillum sulfuroxidans TaxID=611300 RepID=A0ABS5IBJ4_9PROT|nr:hypothetical protein [Magnetospirillum sulfuroxidans]MBR9971795.1 hypothetical protein [Magnetospirillum sulfuroxidans]
MKKQALLIVARTAAGAALVLGLMHWLGVGLPLHVHMACGAALVLALCGLAILGRRRAGWLAWAAIALGLVIPVVGMAQLGHAEMRAILQALHLSLGLGAAAVAEILAKRFCA